MKSRFKVLSLMFVFLLLFGGVALAQNATQVLVQVSYPCDDDQDECDIGEAVSREVGGDVVNVYITLADAAGNPATAGPAGETLTNLTATVSSTKGSIEPNEFLADAQTVSFNGDATARANIDYTDAIPGVDQVIVSVPKDPDPLVGNAEVNVIAPPADRLIARTLRSMAPPQNIYDDIPGQQDNGDADEPAGFDVPVTVIADIGGLLYTPDPALEGQQVTVKAYADYSGDGIAGGGVLTADVAEGYEEDSVGEATFSMVAGIASGTVTVNSAGPAGLEIVFTAEINLGDTDDDGEDNIISTTLMGDAGVDLSDVTVDTVLMQPLSPDALVIGSDPYTNGNLVIPAECYAVFDDATTAVATEIILVDSKGNAVDATADVDVNGDFGTGSTLADQLTFSCTDDMIDTGTYSEGCTILDTNGDPAGTVVQGLLTVSDTEVSADTVDIQLVPASGGVLDLTVTVDEAGNQINAGTEVELTLTASDYLPVLSGDTLEITATNLATSDLQLLSSSDFASADTTLTISASDEDDELAGWQLEPFKIFGPCSTTDGENVQFTVKNATRCDVSAVSDTIDDIEPDDAVNLAVVDLADDVETESELDDKGFVGTEPIVIDSTFLADGSDNALVDGGTGPCDIQVWDEYDNVIDDTPTLLCSSVPGLAIPAITDCDVSVAYTPIAVGQTDTIECEADGESVGTRSFEIPDIVEELAEEGDEATAITIRQEGPQDTDGMLIPPCGEGLIQVSANGTLSSSKNIELSFAEGSTAGAELRALDSDNPIPTPLTVTLLDGDVKRFVVYLPTDGEVTIAGADLGSEPLDAASLALSFCQPPGEPVVAITCDGDPCEACATCTAATTIGGDPIDGTYTWDLNGAAAGTGDSLEVCPEDLNLVEDNTLTVTDTANGDISDSETFPCGGVPGDCTVTTGRDSYLKSHWVPLWNLIVIQAEGEGCNLPLISRPTTVTFECAADENGIFNSILKTGGVKLGSTIVQTVLIWPALLTGNFQDDTEACTVTLNDIDGNEVGSDDFELNIWSIGGIPLAE